MRLPWLTFGVLSIFAGYFLALNCVLGAGVENSFDGEKEFCEVAGWPAGKPANKAFNHEKIFTF